MRFVVAALVALFVFAPAAQAQVTFTGVPTSPTRLTTFDVEFNSPDAISYDCVHVFPDLGTADLPGCTPPFGFRDLVDGKHELKVTATNAGGVKTEGSIAVVVDTAEPPAPVIVSPPENAVVNQTTVIVSGTTVADTAVAVFEGTTKLGDATVTGETWTLEAKDLAEGPHALTAVATDAAGNPSPASAERHITVDTGAPAAPAIDLPAEGAVLRQRMLTLSGSSEAGTRVAIFDGDTRLGETPTGGTSWAFTTGDLADGAHTLKAIATDAAGNPSPESVRHVTIDTLAPAAVEPVQTGASEFTFAGEAGATFECSVDGAGFTPCTSPQQLSGLADGEHTFAVLAVDAAGNRSSSTTRTFSIAQPPAATPVATAAATPAAVPPPAAPAAELGRTLVARTVSGKVYVRRPATTSLVDLGTVAGIPVGTEIDARKGRVRLTAAARPGKAAHRAEFFGGIFTVTQAADDVVDLQLSEPFGSCAKKTGTRVRKLWGDGTGRFRTRGRNSIATVRGTRWLVQDSCDGTLTRVSQGVVSVRDTGKRKTFLVRAGRKYLAVPKRRT